MNKLLIVCCFTVFLALFVFIGVVSAINRGCNINSFTMSPSGPNYNLGDIIRLEGTSNCGTVKFEINGQSYAEIGSTNQTAELKTSEWGNGSHSVCFVARGEGGWENADRRCYSINVTGTPPPPPPPPSRGCDITSFTMSPAGPNYNLGDIIRLEGTSNCGTVKFEINGQSYAEIGSTNQTAELKTSEWGSGSHSVCFVARGNGGWEMADRRCNTINVSSAPPPPQPTQPPAGRGCDISSFTMSPAGPNYSLGTVILLDGRSNCGTVKFEIDGQSYAEIGSTNQTAELKTSEWGAGSHQVCFVARGNGGWEMADRRCNTINVSSAPPPPQPTQPPAGRGCDISSFTMSPSGPNYSLGSTIRLEGTSNCGTVKFEIDGQSYAEIGSTNQTAELKTSEWGAGSHSVCFIARGNGGWEMADRRCNTINVTTTPTQPPQPTQPPAGRGCDISSFTMSPSGPNYALGSIIDLDGTSNCGTVKFEIDGQSRSEIGSTNQNTDLNTNEWGTGSHQVCFVARGNGGWEMADRECKTITISTTATLPPTSTGHGCDIKSFTMSPAGPNYPLGTDILLDGRSTCGTVKFEIDGQSRSEIGSTNQTMNLNTSEWGAGSHQVCFVARSNGGWENADRQCNNITIGGTPTPPGNPPNPRNPPNPSNSVCFVDSFVVNPTSAQPGTIIKLSGTGHCNGVTVRAVRFSINGDPYGEIGAPSQSLEWNTANKPAGNYEIGFYVAPSGDTSWSNAAVAFQTVKLGSSNGAIPGNQTNPDVTPNDASQNNQEISAVNKDDLNCPILINGMTQAVEDVSSTNAWSDLMNEALVKNIRFHLCGIWFPSEPDDDDKRFEITSGFNINPAIGGETKDGEIILNIVYYLSNSDEISRASTIAHEMQHALIKNKYDQDWQALINQKKDCQPDVLLAYINAAFTYEMNAFAREYQFKTGIKLDPNNPEHRNQLNDEFGIFNKYKGGYEKIITTTAKCTPPDPLAGKTGTIMYDSQSGQITVDWIDTGQDNGWWNLWGLLNK